MSVKPTAVLTPASARMKSFAFTPGTLALAISAALVADLAVAERSNIALDKLTVEEELTPDTNPYAEPGAPYLGKYSADPRRSRPIAETPQSITVLTQEEIRDTGRSDLREILDGQPGITLGTGENGNAFGDRYIIRGHEARSDMFVDGLRDPGMTIRESFAVEQLEISKGPSATFAGRGTTGGAVNSATKRASTEYDFTKLSGGLGSDSYHRATIDANKVINYDTAVRLNLLHAAEDVPDRSPAARERRGGAVSLLHQPSDALEIAIDYYHLDANDRPDLGTYIESLGGGAYGDPVDDIPVYLQKEDFLESSVDTLTLRLGYELTPSTRLINLTRYGATDNGYVTTGARGTTAYASEADALAAANGFASVGLSTHQGWQEVEYFANQLNLLTRQQLAGLNHEFIFSAEYSDQRVLNGVYDNTANGASNCWTVRGANANQGYCLSDASGNAVADVNNLLQRDISKGRWDADWNVRTFSLSAMDTVDLNDRWTLFGGVRMDHFRYDTRTQNSALAVTKYKYSDTLWNGHAGVSYELRPGAKVYASVSTASNINGGESDVGSSCGYGGICTDASANSLGTPENTRSIELGTKWQLMGDKLLATAALFRITKDDVMEQLPSGTGYADFGTLNTGRNRVEGVEFGLSGNLTRKLSAQAGVTLMNAKVLDSNNPDNIGKTLANFADKSASLHLKYQATPKFAFGGTLTYEGERYAGQPDSAANEALEIPAYTTVDVFATYAFDRNLRARLNIGNLTNEDYYLAAYRSGAFAYKGDARNARLSVEYDF